jgi:serine/threonine protein kinase
MAYRCKIKLALEVACILKSMHHFGVVHGDLKCSNILIADNESPVLCDFGSSVCLKDPPKAECGHWFVPSLWV